MATTLDRADETLIPAQSSGKSQGSAGLSIPDLVFALLLVIGTLAVYFRTLCPTIYTADCGEIATAVATGGVMHPPGYPLYSLIGGLLVHLIPWGEPAWRLGFLSAVPGAGAVALAYILGRRLGAGRIWSLAASLAFAFSYSVWEQATKVETYALNAFFVALLLNLAVMYVQAPSRPRFFALAFSSGLALTNHLSTLWLLPAIAVMVLPALHKQEGVKGFVGLFLAGVCLGILPLGLYGYEIYAARTHPGGQVWGDPSNLYRFYLHVTGAQYHDFFKLMTLPKMIARDFVFLPKFLWRNLGLWLAAAIAGAVALYRDGQRGIALGLLVGVGGYLLCNTIYGIPNIYEYYTPAVLILAVLGAAGAQRLTRTIVERMQEDTPLVLGASSLVIVLLAAAIPLRANLPFCDRSHVTFVRTLGENILQPLPKNAVVIAEGDTVLFSLWYAQDVLGERRDVLVATSTLTGAFGPKSWNQLALWFLKKMAHSDPSIPVSQLIAHADADTAYARGGGPLWDILQMEYSRGRPLYIAGSDQFSGMRTTELSTLVEGTHSGPPLPKLYFVTEGLAQRLVPETEIPNKHQSLETNLAAEKLIRLDTPQLSAVLPDTVDSVPDEMTTAKLYVDFLTYEGSLLDDTARFQEAYDRLSRAHALNPWSARTENAYALACFMTGRRDQALASWQAAIKLDPTNPLYQQNLQRAVRQAPQTNTGQ
ncbi:MAG TPA: DUF2723 domain-containing protein [Capsulimonadaceae bacterium]|nr:DUF2723 domain-containing protein [Capsulimonadaceae bacterium]